MLNLWENISDFPQKEEVVNVLLENDSIRIERIISYAQKSPPGFWYDQAENEWILLLKGSASLEFKDPDEIVALKPGDYLLIKSHRKHRVHKTHPASKTIWLTMYYNDTPKK